jgi:hypothetical protein
MTKRGVQALIGKFVARVTDDNEIDRDTGVAGKFLLKVTVNISCCKKVAMVFTGVFQTGNCSEWGCKNILNGNIKSHGRQLLCDRILAFAGCVGNKPERISSVPEEINGFPGSFDRLVPNIQNPIKIDEKTLMSFISTLSCCVAGSWQDVVLYPVVSDSFCLSGRFFSYHVFPLLPFSP